MKHASSLRLSDAVVLSYVAIHVVVNLKLCAHTFDQLADAI